MDRHQLCTYFDVHYYLKGRALIQSLQLHVSDFTLWVLCLDELTFELLSALDDQRVRPVRLGELEAWEPRLPAAKSDRSLVEYYWTCTPTWLAFIMDRQPRGAWVSYLDADLCFFGGLDDVFIEAGLASVIIHGHRFSAANEYQAATSGIYNVGLTSFRCDELGWQAVRWWQAVCLEACYLRPEDGYCGDQKYLDDWPTRFAGVHVLQNPAAGLAPWNVDNYEYDRREGRLRVAGQPLIFYHFHALELLSPHVIGQRGYDIPNLVHQEVYLTYGRSLVQLLQQTREIQPAFHYGFRRPPWRQLWHDLINRRYFWV